MTFGSLFAGIGGFDLGLERAGMGCRWQVEKNDFCKKVLEKHWPKMPRFSDVRDVGKENLSQVDLICGGFPCQPFSHAGKQPGETDDRYLWPEMSRIVEELRPTWVLGENVVGFVKMALYRTILDLENLGYACQAFTIPACAVSAPHQRNRVWIVGYSDTKGQPTLSVDAEVGIVQESAAYAQGAECKRQRETRNGRARLADHCEWKTEPRVGRVVDGFPGRVERVRSLGNAVVPQLVEEIGRMIIEANGQ